MTVRRPASPGWQTHTAGGARPALTISTPIITHARESSLYFRLGAATRQGQVWLLLCRYSCYHFYLYEYMQCDLLFYTFALRRCIPLQGCCFRAQCIGEGGAYQHGCILLPPPLHIFYYSKLYVFFIIGSGFLPLQCSCVSALSFTIFLHLFFNNMVLPASMMST